MRLGSGRRKHRRSTGGSLLTGLVSWWDLTADGNDSHGGNNLSARGSPTFGTVDGFVCVSTSVDNHLYNASPSTLPSLSTMTVCAWARRTTTNSAMLVVQQGDGTNAGDTRYGLKISNNDTYFRVSDNVGPTAHDTQVSGSVPLNTWMLLVGQFNIATGDAAMYLNVGGTLYTATANYGAITLNTVAGNGVGIGGDGDGSGTGNELIGSITSAGIWNRILDADERLALYNSGTPLKYAGL